MTHQPTILASVQAARGVAALMVVFYHVELFLWQKGGHIVFGSAAKLGALGVNFFFVLSGFIILMAHQRDIGNTSALPRYAARRFTRIFPMYWVCLTLYIAAAYLGFGEPDFSWNPLQILNAYTLVYWVPPELSLPLKVAWTLVYELRFYFLFAAFLINFRFGLAIFLLWAALICYGTIFEHRDLQRFASLWNVHFFFGMGAYVAYRVTPVTWVPAIGVSAIAVLVPIAIYRPDVGSVWGTLCTAFGFAGVLVTCVVVELRFKCRLPRVALFVGDASYSIYLVHSAVLTVIMAIYQKLGVVAQIGLVLSFALAFIAAVVASCFAYVLIERPMLMAFRPRRKQLFERPDQVSEVAHLIDDGLRRTSA